MTYGAWHDHPSGDVCSSQQGYEQNATPADAKPKTATSPVPCFRWSVTLAGWICASKNEGNPELHCRDMATPASQCSAPRACHTPMGRVGAELTLGCGESNAQGACACSLQLDILQVAPRLLRNAQHGGVARAESGQQPLPQVAAFSLRLLLLLLLLLLALCLLLGTAEEAQHLLVRPAPAAGSHRVRGLADNAMPRAESKRLSYTAPKKSLAQNLIQMMQGMCCFLRNSGRDVARTTTPPPPQTPSPPPTHATKTPSSTECLRLT
jgi:hypothetical protein